MQKSSSLRKLARRPLAAALVVALLLFVDHVLGGPSSPSATPSGSASSRPPKNEPAPESAAERPPVVQSEKDIEGIEDPITLADAGRYWLAHGKRELARKCFQASVARHEVNLYTEFDGQPWAEAVVHEHMGEHGKAEATWKKSIELDVQSTYHALAHFSRHPRREALLEAAKKHVLDIVEQAKAGGQPTIYTTKKGEPRPLVPMTQEEAEKYFAEGELIRYAYFEVLDLSKRVWPKRVGCQRCVAGKILAWDADFEEQLDFKGFILEDFHVGKKWKGEVNKSAFEPASRFNRLYVDGSVFFGRADFDSIRLTGRVANMPFAVFTGETNFRNADFGGIAELRFAHFQKPVSFKGTRFDDSAYFAYGHFAGLDLSRTQAPNRPVHFASATFAGDLLVEDAAFHHGATFENAQFSGNVTFRRCFLDGRLNLSRARTQGTFLFERNEAKDLLMYGGVVEKSARFSNNLIHGSSRFALDELTRRQHIDDVEPLHKLYKLYQGDDDAEEDLTKKSQYGVTHVDDLVSRFHGETSFANTNFEQLVGFERVVFGNEADEAPTSFYNAQFGGEAHFERATFHGIADFRTIGGEEVSFNQARFHGDWLLDDANVPGRLSMTEADLLGRATVSLAGADIQAFGIDYRQLLHDVDEIWEVGGHRLFYERCVHDLRAGRDAQKYIDDPRLVDARWDASGDRRLTEESEILARARDLCIGRTVDEFTRLRNAFEQRSMSDESDWAYWHLKHYINHRRSVEGRVSAIIAFGERLVFEKAFGWGVLLANLIVTAFVVILVYAVLMRMFCGDMEIVWDGEPTVYRDLSPFALLVISMHAFLGGFGVADEFVKNSSSPFKALFTAEMATGIVVITFFIGAYTRMVVSG